jgi:hypothetical protein
MKEKVEFVGVLVKVGDKLKIVERGSCYFRGWEYADDDMSDSGVDLELTIGKERCKLSL